MIRFITEVAFVYCAVLTESLNINLINFRIRKVKDETFFEFESFRRVFFSKCRTKFQWRRSNFRAAYIQSFGCFVMCTRAPK